jgi:acetyl esterase/lipase
MKRVEFILCLFLFFFSCGEGEDLKCVDRNGIFIGKEWRFIPSLVYDEENQLKGDLYLPSKGFKKPYPAIIFNHGGGWTAGTRRMTNSQYWGEHFACRGYAFFDVDYRLAPSIKFPQDIRDVKCAIRWLRGKAKFYGIDREKFISMGGSAGGHITAMIAVTPDDEFFKPTCNVFPDERVDVQAAIPFYGIYDWTKWYDTFGRFLDLGEVYLGEEPPSEEILRKASPIFYVEKTNAHFLIIHGTGDPIPVEQAENFHKALIDNGKDSRLVLIEGANHAFDNMIDSEFTKEAEEKMDEFLMEIFGR